MKKLIKNLIWALKTFLLVFDGTLKIETSFILKYLYFIQFSKSKSLKINCKDYEECKLIYDSIIRYPKMGFIKEQLNDNPNYKGRLTIFKEVRSMDNLILKCIRLQYKKPILKMNVNISKNKDIYDYDVSTLYPSKMMEVNINGI